MVLAAEPFLICSMAIETQKIRDSKILVIDDSEDLSPLYKMFLQTNGFGDISIAGSLEEAIEKIADNNPFDLYITDAAYPLKRNRPEDKQAWINLYEHLKKTIRNFDPDKLLVVSAYNLKKDVESLGLSFLSKGEGTFFDDLVDWVKLRTS